MKTKRGWVPASYLEPLDSPDEAEDPDPNYAGAPCPLRQYGVWDEGEEGVQGHEEASQHFSVIVRLVMLVRKVGSREGQGGADIWDR